MQVNAMAQHYGWIPDVPDDRDFQYQAAAAELRALPSRFELQDLPPVYNQGSLGSCTWQAVAGAIHWNELQQKLVTVVAPSRLFGYWNTRHLEGTVQTDSGASMRNAIKAAVQWGYCPESIWPYTIERFRDKPPVQAYAAAEPNRIVDYSRVQQDLDQLKAVLVSRDPVPFGFAVYPSFESRETVRTGIVSMPTQRELLLGKIGGHAVLLVGYDDASGQFKFRNSYGVQWGERGYGYLPYAYVATPSLAADFWLIRTVPENGPVPPPSPPPGPPAPSRGLVTVDPDGTVTVPKAGWQVNYV